MHFPHFLHACQAGMELEMALGFRRDSEHGGFAGKMVAYYGLLRFTMVYYGFTMVLLWFYYGFTMVYYGFTMVYYGFTMVLLRFTMVLLWFY